MALFHLSVTQTKRSAGQSAIASAAYRAGERLYSEYYTFINDDEVEINGKRYEIYRGYENGSRGNYGIKCKEK